MSTNFTPADDFAAVTDGLESVTLLRRESPLGPGVVIAHALHRTIDIAEVLGDNRKTIESDGRYLAADAAWSLPAAELTGAPRLGDRLLDAAGRRWTILEVRLIALDTRYRCRTRELSLAYGLEDIVAILKAEYSKSESGAVETTWTVLHDNLRARIQPKDTRISPLPTTQRSIERFQIILEEAFDLDHTYRIRDSNNTSYRIVTVGGFPKLGELQMVEVEKIQA